MSISGPPLDPGRSPPAMVTMYTWRVTFVVQ
jgi:hypothetical protein